MACVELPAFPLQLLLKRHPDWRERPAAVIDQDKPQGVLLWVNERARATRLLPGMRYSAGLALARDLRAAEVPRAEIDRAVAGLARELRRFTPHVEPAEGEPGVFWLDASGLERLYESRHRWAGSIRDAIERAGFRSTVVVGFSRFGTYALARAKRGVIVFDHATEEHAATRSVPLDRLALEPAARDALQRLGVETVGRFMDLPAEGIETRFGTATARLHRLAAGTLRLPLQPDRPQPPAVERRILDYAETDVARLMYRIERMIDPLLATLAARNEASCEIVVGFRFEGRGDHLEAVRPAAPTLDAAQLLDLIRLRLQAIRRLPAGVVELWLAGRGVEATPGQLQLFAQQPRRDLAAVNRGLARVRAELGEGAVVRAELREGHLPEGTFTWERLDELKVASPRPVDAGTMVRRIHLRPIPLPPRPRQEPDGWMPHGLTGGPVVRVLGPYVVSGGWWRREVHREYHFAETRNGELLWLYYDRPRRRWFLHGRVE